MEGARGGGQTVAIAVKSGFETAIPVSQADKTFTVQALDAHGKVIGTSREFSVGG